jgi:hypothetical protein
VFGPHFHFEFKIKYLNSKLVIFIIRCPKNSKKSNFFKFRPPSTYKYRLRSIFKKKTKILKLVIYFMYRILNFYTIVFSIFCVKMNYKMIKCRMLVPTGRKKADVADVDVSVDWML